VRGIFAVSAFARHSREVLHYSRRLFKQESSAFRFFPYGSERQQQQKSHWIPAFAGMTGKNNSNSDSKWIPAFTGMTSNSTTPPTP
jgi:hypothetical protein